MPLRIQPCNRPARHGTARQGTAGHGRAGQGRAGQGRAGRRSLAQPQQANSLRVWRCGAGPGAAAVERHQRKHALVGVGALATSWWPVPAYAAQRESMLSAPSQWPARLAGGPGSGGPGWWARQVGQAGGRWARRPASFREGDEYHVGCARLLALLATPSPATVAA